MSERGVFAIDRGVFDHECFAAEPFTEREAWVWLIGAVVWKDKTVRVGKFVAALKRGQGAFSVRFLAEKWQWSKSRVDRFLDKLKNRDMVETASGTGITVVTIHNYNQYQRVSLPGGTVIETQTGTAAGQQRDKEEDIKDIKDKEQKDTSLRSDWPSDFRDQFWKLYPKRVGKKAAISELDRVRKRGDVPWSRLIAALTAYAATADPQFTKDPERWLKKGCWDDEPDTRKPNGQPAASPILKALDNTRDKLRSLGIRHGTSADHARLLPQGGGERSGTVLDGGRWASGAIRPGGDPRCDAPAERPAEPNGLHADAQGVKGGL